MARGTSLATLRSMLKTECGYNLQVGVAVAQDTELNGVLAQTQQWLWTQYQWPFLYGHEDVATSQGVRYYPLPSIISLDYPTRLETKWGNRWYDVGYGISGDEYEAIDPDRGMTFDPIRRWQIYFATQIEVWPVPSSVQTLRVWGTGQLGVLVADDDVAYLDDLLIVLFAAAEKLKRNKQADSSDKLNRANVLFNRLRGADRPNTVFTLGGEGIETGTKVLSIRSNPNQ